MYVCTYENIYTYTYTHIYIEGEGERVNPRGVPYGVKHIIILSGNPNPRH